MLLGVGRPQRLGGMRSEEVVKWGAFGTRFYRVFIQLLLETIRRGSG